MHRKSHTGFRLVPKVVTSRDLERGNDFLRYCTECGQLPNSSKVLQLCAYCLRQKFNPQNLLFRSIWFIIADARFFLIFPQNDPPTPTWPRNAVKRRNFFFTFTSWRHLSLRAVHRATSLLRTTTAYNLRGHLSNSWALVTMLLLVYECRN